MDNKCVSMARGMIVDNIWSSICLDGKSISRDRISSIVSNDVELGSSKEDILVANMKSAWEFVLRGVDTNDSLLYMCDLNRIILHGISDSGGCFRNEEVFIGDTNWKPDLPDESYICYMIDKIEGIESSLDRALKYFCFISRTKIFAEGNSRVAQLMANRVLIENEIGVLQVPVDGLKTFRYLLLRFYESANDSALVDFMKKFCVKYCVE